MRISSLFLTTLVVVLSFSPLSNGAAPKCAYTPTIERARNSKAVFSGQVLDIKKLGEIEEVRFKVLKSWKYVRGGEVIVFNFPQHESPHYYVGHTYLVFADGDGKRLATGICSGTREVRFARKEVRQLDRWWRRNKSKRR